MLEKDRIAWLDAVKGMAIALVVASHCIGGEWFYPFSTFMMPLFFVAAGYSLNLQKWQARRSEFFWSRARRILVPYFVMEICFWPLWSVRGLYMPPVGTRLSPLEALFGIFEGNCASLPLIALWFLPCFFLAENIFLWAFPDSLGKVQIVRDILVAMALSALGYGISCFVHLPWGLDIALFVQGYLMLGRWLRLVGVHRLSAAWCVLLPVFLIALQVYVNGSFDMASRTYGMNPLLAYISNIGGCIMVMRIMQLLIKDKGASLAEIGRRSMSIYILHPLVQIIITDILLSTIIEGDYGTIFYVWQAGIPIAILGILLPMYVSRYWAQKPFLRYLGL